MAPNLFRYATKELSQDAFLCWLLAWADQRNARADEVLHGVGLAFLNTLLELHHQQPKENVQVMVRQQVRGADIIAEVGDDLVMLIEDKVDAGVHGNQLDRYRESIGQEYQGRQVLPVLLKTGAQIGYKEVEYAGYHPFPRDRLLGLLRPWRGRTSNAILIDFLDHLEQRQAETEAYAVEPVAAWTERWDPWTGFYERLRREFPELDWGYVSNPRGGFIAAWWHFKRWTDPQTGLIHDAYLQIEQGPLCFRLATSEDEKDKAGPRDRCSARLVALGREAGLAVKRPSRFGLGTTMAVSRIERKVWLAEHPDGSLDLGATLANLRKAASIMDRLGERNLVVGAV